LTHSSKKKRQATPAVKTQPSIWQPPVQQLHVIPDDARFEDYGAAIKCCITPIDDKTTDKPSWTQAIDKKMQYKWREDLLPEEK
jgi:hypothetical protein